jgi:hypothetical protein
VRLLLCRPPCTQSQRRFFGVMRTSKCSAEISVGQLGESRSRCKSLFQPELRAYRCSYQFNRCGSQYTRACCFFLVPCVPRKFRVLCSVHARQQELQPCSLYELLQPSLLTVQYQPQTQQSSGKKQLCMLSFLSRMKVFYDSTSTNCIALQCLCFPLRRVSAGTQRVTW